MRVGDIVNEALRSATLLHSYVAKRHEHLTETKRRRIIADSITIDSCNAHEKQQRPDDE